MLARRRASPGEAGYEPRRPLDSLLRRPDYTGTMAESIGVPARTPQPPSQSEYRAGEPVPATGGTGGGSDVEPDPVERDSLGRRKWPEERIPIDLEPIPGFNLQAQVVGQGGSYVKYIQQETRCRVQIK